MAFQSFHCICCLPASLASPQAYFSSIINILLLSAWIFFSFSCYHWGVKTEPSTLPVLPSANKSGFPYRRITRIRVQRGPSLCLRLKRVNYSFVWQTRSEIPSLTKHSKRIRTLTQLRNMQFSHCYFTEKPSSSCGPTQPEYKKNVWKTLEKIPSSHRWRRKFTTWLWCYW